LSCTVTVGPQEGKKEIFFTNEGTGTTRHIHMYIEIRGLTFTQKAGLGCESGTFKDGIIYGEADLIGHGEKGQEGIWVE
jgi:hypothetical protein